MHSNHRKRMRNRYYKAYLSGSAVDGFADHEILEMFLFYAIPRQDTNPIAHRLMREFGSLNGVFSACG
jgi:DNA repair protein RadC